MVTSFGLKNQELFFDKTFFFNLKFYIFRPFVLDHAHFYIKCCDILNLNFDFIIFYSEWI